MLNLFAFVVLHSVSENILSHRIDRLSKCKSVCVLKELTQLMLKLKKFGTMFCDHIVFIFLKTNCNSPVTKILI